jgi:hypothetical protein
MPKNITRSLWIAHENAEETGNGDIFYTSVYDEIANIEITGTGESTVAFEGDAFGDGNFYPIMGVKLSDFSLATEVSEKGVVYQVPLLGLKAFRARISAYTSGAVTVKGVVIG